MKAFLTTVFIGLAAAESSGGGKSVTPSRCKNVQFTVNGTAQNRNITGIPTSSLSALVSFFQAAPVTTVTGPQTLSGTYCEATTKNWNNDKLQVMYNSIFANRDSWSALGGTSLGYPQVQPQLYSWVDFMNARGFPTLAMDRLGNGQSSHPDPIIVAQAPYEIALYHNLAQQIRAGTTKVLPRTFNYLIYVGNSYGSQIGAGTAGTYANDGYNDFVLTGFSDNFQQDFVGVTLAGPAPAAVADPARFGTLSPGYLTTTSESGQTGAFFGSHRQVDFNDTVAATFFQRRDVVSLGQLASIYGLVFNAPNYKGKVLVLDGEQDQATCGPGSPTLGDASCAARGEPKLTGTLLFPAAQYNYITVNKVGHGVQLHYRSPILFELAYLYLSGQKFNGGIV